MAEVLPEHGGALAEAGLLVLFGVLFAWISAGFWTGVMGAWVLLVGRGRSPLMRGLGEQPCCARSTPTARTAIVMPICNEHVPTVFGGLRGDDRIARRDRRVEHFDFFVLSDTIRSRHPRRRAGGVERARDAARSPTPTARAAVAVHYRWRQHRTKRKAGNVADFCRRWGAAYRYMIVLDADSVMTGECLTTLVRLMEAHPDAGIIQTAPRAVGHETLHARIQQFAARVYGPLFTAGHALLAARRIALLGPQRDPAHGAVHGALRAARRCRATARSSGEVMSHDFVEAALMRRAGWKVWVADELDGSYEQVPPNLLAELQRDRRWCHGNLQNSRLMFEPRPARGASHRVPHRRARLCVVAALARVPAAVDAAVRAARGQRSRPTSSSPYQLFPIWPTANFTLMLTLFGLTAVLLLAPKVMSLIAIVLRGEARRFGGVARLLASAFIEFLHSLLLAPVRMLFHTQFVLAALTGWRLDWKSPPRDDAATPWREALRAPRRAHRCWRSSGSRAIVATSAAFPWWLSPIIAGLLTAIPLSVLSSRSAHRSVRCARRGLMLTPEEAASRACCRRPDAPARTSPASAARRSVRRSLDPASHAACRRRAAGARRPRGAQGCQAESRLVEHALPTARKRSPPAISLRLLASAAALATLRREVLARRAHPAGGGTIARGTGRARDVPAVPHRAERRSRARCADRSDRARCVSGKVAAATLARSVAPSARHGRRHRHPAPHPARLPDDRRRRPVGRVAPAELLRRQVHAGARLPHHPGQPALRRDPGRALLRERWTTSPMPVDMVDVFRRTEDVLPIAAAGDRDRREVPVAADRRQEPRGRRAGARGRARRR